MFNTPILLLVFNKTDTTKQVFEQIRAMQPKQLFVVGDGPRQGHPEDIKKCDTVKRLVLEGVDWDCDLRTLFRDENLGCGRGPASAITWFFSQVDKGIILEDDCLPVPAFFHYCALLLDKYETDERVMHISGHNPVPEEGKGLQLLFSKYSFIWGWATWSRAWSKYDYTLASWAETGAKKKIRSAVTSELEYKYWKIHFDKYSAESLKPTWDYQWQYTLFMNDGLSVVPTTSFIYNIGIGHPDATHTTQAELVEPVPTQTKTLKSEQTLSGLKFPVALDATFDAKVFNEVFVHWLPKFNLKALIYSYLPGSVKKAITQLKSKG